jgi:hypothetical protein
MKASVMLTEKNLHAFVDPALLEKMQQAAQNEHLTLDEFVSDAIERRLNKHEFEEVLAFGKGHARRRGLKPGDVVTAIADERRGNKERGR